MASPSIVYTLLPDPETPGATLDREATSITPGTDWALDNDGDLIIPMRFTTGVEAVAQGIRIRIQIFLGEWFANLELGVDYYGEILGQKFEEVRVRGALRDIIFNSPGVEEIISLTATYESDIRKVSIDWEVLTDLSTDPITGSLVL